MADKRSEEEKAREAFGIAAHDLHHLAVNAGIPDELFDMVGALCKAYPDPREDH